MSDKIIIISVIMNVLLIIACVTGICFLVYIHHPCWSWMPFLIALADTITVTSTKREVN